MVNPVTVMTNTTTGPAGQTIPVANAGVATPQPAAVPQELANNRPVSKV